MVAGVSGGHGYNDLRALLHLRALLATLNGSGPPSVLAVHQPAGEPAERIGVLAGAFNPPTSAHTNLAETVRHAARLSAVFFLLSTRTVDKESVGGALLEDRLQMLRLHAVGRPGMGVLVANCGLYVDQAEAIHRAFPALRELCFVVGFDKIRQIFDPCYYADRDAALRALFARAALLVAPRGGFGNADEQRAELARLLAEPENEPYGARVAMIPLPPDLAEVSSSRARAEAAGGAVAATALPREVAAFIVDTGAYLPPAPLSDGAGLDRYTVRVRLLEALASAGQHLPHRADLGTLLALAWADNPRGRRVRALLDEQPAAALDELRRAGALS